MITRWKVWLYDNSRYLLYNENDYHRLLQDNNNDTGNNNGGTNDTAGNTTDDTDIRFDVNPI